MSWKMFGKGKKARRRPRLGRGRLRLERLEDRCLLDGNDGGIINTCSRSHVKKFWAIAQIVLTAQDRPRDLCNSHRRKQ